MPFIISGYPANFIINLVRANFAYPKYCKKFQKAFSHLGLPNSVPIDDGLVNAPVVLSTHASRRASSTGDVSFSFSAGQAHLRDTYRHRTSTLQGCVSKYVLGILQTPSDLSVVEMRVLLPNLVLCVKSSS
jgi:hypothetical protein